VQQLTGATPDPKLVDGAVEASMKG
jgi:F-type H+-transporting ATPase subunit b